MVLLNWFSGGCKTAPRVFERSPLSMQIIHPHPDHKPFLVNQRRVFAPDGKESLDVIKYDLRDRKLRLELRELMFACNVNGKLYRIAQEEPGLIRETYSQKCFLFICGEKKLETVDVKRVESDYDFLLKSNTRCYSLKQYPFNFGG